MPGQAEQRHIPRMKDSVIIGVDEVGRGCIAGDLLVCAFAFRRGIPQEERAMILDGAKDSKAFSSRKKRAALVPLLERCGVVHYARRTPEEIDRSDIRLATLSAMAEAANAVRASLDRGGASKVIVDGRDLPPGIADPVEAMIKGDASVIEISCASILAKVARDEEMTSLAELFPGYGFEKHAGYGTKQHIEAIGRMGTCPIHRSWARKFSA